MDHWKSKPRSTSGPLSLLRQVYDLDTLDTRFTTSSNTPYRVVVEARSDPAATSELASSVKIRAKPSKWRTPEFYLYYAVFILVVPLMFWIPYTVSRPSDPRYRKYERLLSDGWIPGRKVDVTDQQYRFFRGNLVFLLALLALHPALRRVWNKVRSLPRNNSAADRLNQRVSFDYAFAALFLLALHGVSAFKVLTILWINFRLAKTLPRSKIPLGTWLFNVPILFANELCQGYRFRNMAAWVSPPNSSFSGRPEDSTLMQWGQWVDGYGGLVTRWEVLFNLTILRLISFNMDYYWSLDRPGSVAAEKKQLDQANLSERDRVQVSADAHEYSFRNYIAYTLYAPLYLVGPIITFNDYISQNKYRPASIERRRTILYALRFALVLLANELILHFDYVGAISKARPNWNSYTASELSLLSFMNLHLIWLKLLLPFRLFRLWALIDGIDPPENMVRCVSNNYSTQMFWRGWHRSYNRWIIRYIYVPLGGSSFRTWQSTLRSVVTYLLSFTFVALWHDIQLRLLIWGWLIVIFMVPEWTAAFLFPKRRYENRPDTYRMLCCVGAVGNVLMMISANLVGFAVGLDGLEVILKSILHQWSGVMFLVTACACLFVGIQVMFELREAEKRKGISMKC